MTIELIKSIILEDIRKKSYYECQSVPDIDARYRTEAGTEKMDEIRRDMEEGFMQLNRRCVRWLNNSYTAFADNTQPESESMVYDFKISERRANGKIEPLTDAMHRLVVEYALSKFYSTVNAVDLSNKHSLHAIDAANEIDELLYTKQPPIL